MRTEVNMLRLHASCVAVGTRAVLICGAAGSGKSALALALLAYGAALVSDDRTVVREVEGWPVASAPCELSGLIEARGIGLLAASVCPAAPVVLKVDLDQAETDRLPPERATRILGQEVPLLHKVEGPHFAAAVLQYLKAGRAAI